MNIQRGIGILLFALVTCVLGTPRADAQSASTRYAAIWERRPGPAWAARHGLTSAAYQQEFNRLTGLGYRPIEVNGYGVGGRDYYAAIWERRSGPAWVARHGLTSAAYQQEFNRLTGLGYRLIDVSGYNVGGQARYAGIWERRSGPAWVARHGLTSAAYQREFDRLTGLGYRLIDVSGYAIRGQDYYAAIWERRSGPAWVARHGLTSAQYQTAFNNYTADGYHPIDVSGWGNNGTAHFAAIWERGSSPAWVARHGLTSAEYQAAFDQFVREGYRLVHVSGYSPNN